MLKSAYKTTWFTISLLALAVAGCGGSSTSSKPPTSSASTAASSSTPKASQEASPGGSQASAPRKAAHPPSGTIAKVNGVVITTAAYEQWLSKAISAPVRSMLSDPAGCPAAMKQKEELSEKAEQKAEKEGKSFRIGPKSPQPKTQAQFKTLCERQAAEVKLQGARFLIRNAQTLIQARELGVSVDESQLAKESSKWTLVQNQIRTKVEHRFGKTTAPSQTALQKYFNEHKQIFAKPETRSLAYVETPSKSVAEAIASTHRSGGLATAAAKQSLTVTPTIAHCGESAASNGGHVPPIYAAICSAKTGVTTGPIKMPSKYFVIEVKSVSSAVKPSFDKAKERVKQELFISTKGREESKYFTEVRRRLKDRTECAAGYVVELCKEYVRPAGAPPGLGE